MQLKGQSKYASRLDTCEVSTFYFLNKGFAAVRSKVNNAAEGELHEEVGTGGVQAVSQIKHTHEHKRTQKVDCMDKQVDYDKQCILAE